jgi:hypothetical protein
MPAPNDNKKSNHWEELVQEKPGTPLFPQTNLTVRLTHGVWFGVAMGIGFAIGFLISFLLLMAFVGFIIYSKFPGLFS